MCRYKRSIGYNAWYTRVAYHVKDKLKKNESYMLDHASDYESRFGESEMLHLKSWFEAQKDLDRDARDKAKKSGSSGGKGSKRGTRLQQLRAQCFRQHAGHNKKQFMSEQVANSKGEVLSFGEGAGGGSAAGSGGGDSITKGSRAPSEEGSAPAGSKKAKGASRGPAGASTGGGGCRNGSEAGGGKAKGKGKGKGATAEDKPEEEEDGCSSFPEESDSEDEEAERMKAGEAGEGPLSEAEEIDGGEGDDGSEVKEMEGPTKRPRKSAWFELQELMAASKKQAEKRQERQHGMMMDVVDRLVKARGSSSGGGVGHENTWRRGRSTFKSIR